MHRHGPGHLSNDRKMPPPAGSPLAVYLMNTSIKDVSSMKLHRDLGVTQKTAWYLAHRIRKAPVSGVDWVMGNDDPFSII